MKVLRQELSQACSLIKSLLPVRQNWKRELKSETTVGYGTGTFTQGFPGPVRALGKSHCEGENAGRLVTWLWWGQGRWMTPWCLSSWKTSSIAIHRARGDLLGKQVNQSLEGEHAGSGSVPRAGTPVLRSPRLSWLVSTSWILHLLQENGVSGGWNVPVHPFLAACVAGNCPSVINCPSGKKGWEWLCCCCGDYG